MPLLKRRPTRTKTPRTARYREGSWGWGSTHFRLGHDKPPFSYSIIDAMRLDPRVCMNLAYIFGPIIKGTWTVQSANAEVAQFVDRQLKRFWGKGVRRALTAISYGFAAGEVIYRESNGRVEYDRLSDVHPRDARLLTRDGRFYGVRVKKDVGDLVGPEAFWFVHNRQWGGWYGTSRLHGAYGPFWEKWDRHGAIDVRRLFFYKYAFDGGTIRYPEGDQIDENSQSIPNRDIARQMGERARAGAMKFFPSERDGAGNPLWDHEQAQAPAGDFSQMLKYPEGLDGEIDDGMIVPSEIKEAANTGSGFSGRFVPLMGFYSTLELPFQDLIEAFDDMVIKALVMLNFGAVDYGIKPDELKPPAAPDGMEETQPGGEESSEVGQPGPGTAGGGPRAPQPAAGGAPAPGVNGNGNGAIRTRRGAPGGRMRPAARRSAIQSARRFARVAELSDRFNLDGNARRILMGYAMATAHAPKGGATVAGKQFKGGEFIPSEVLAQASDEERAALAGTDTSKRRKGGFASKSVVRKAIPDSKIDSQPATKKLRKIAESLDEATIASVRTYTDYDSEAITIQAHLRFGKKLDPDQQAMFDEHATNLAAAIEASDVPPGTTVYRGMTSGVDLGAFTPGEDIQLKGFTSTSLNPGVAQPLAFSESDESAIFEIKPKKGLYVTPHSTSEGNQQEVLLNHNARYRVVAVHRDVTFEDDFGEEPGFNVIQLEEV